MAFTRPTICNLITFSRIRQSSFVETVYQPEVLREVPSGKKKLEQLSHQNENNASSLMSSGGATAPN